MRSFLISALCLVLVPEASARVARSNQGVQLRRPDSEAVQGIRNFFNQLLRKDLHQRAPAATCNQDQYWTFVANSSFGQSFCEEYYDYPNNTRTIEYTPTTTVVNTYTSETSTNVIVVHTTASTTDTVTVSPSPAVTRRAAPHRNNLVNDVFQAFRRQQAADNDTSSVGNAAMSASFSSACSCQPYAGATVTATYTYPAATTTVSAYYQTAITTTTTRTDGTIATTTTVTGSAAPTPTGPVYSCPGDDNQEISQLVNGTRYDYMIMCNVSIPANETFYDEFRYPSFQECINSCSSINQMFTGQVPICQGVTYDPSATGYNCAVKSGADYKEASNTTDTAVLVRVVRGVSGDSPSGTTTEGFTSAANPTSMSSSVASAMSNSTTSMPMSTVPQGGMGPITSFSTFVSNGQTYSTATAFSTYYTSNGSWYYSYYTSWSESWQQASTVYGITPYQTIIANSSTSSSNLLGGNGTYTVISVHNTTVYTPTGYNVTEVQANNTYASNDTFLSGTTSTYYFAYTTASAAAASGGAAGGAGGGGSGPITSVSTTSSVTTISGGTGGASSFLTGGPITPAATPTPSTVQLTSITTIVASGASSGAESGAASGAGSGGASGYTTTIETTSTTEFATTRTFATGSEASFAASGELRSYTVYTSIYSTVQSGFTSYSTYLSTSYYPEVTGSGTGYVSSGVASGALSSGESNSSTVVVPGSSILLSTLTGTPGGTGGASSFMTGGPFPSSSSLSGSMVMSTGASSSTVAPPINTAPSVYSPISSGVMSGGTGSAFSTATGGPIPSSSNSTTVPESGAPRSGTYSTSSTSVPESGAPRSGTYSTTSTMGGTAPLSTAPTSPASSGFVPSSGSPSSSSPMMMTAPSPTGPQPYYPHSTSSSSENFNNESGGRVGSYSTTISTESFSNESGGRSGGYSTSSLGTGPLLSTGTSPPLNTAPLSTGPSPPLYTAPLSTGPSPPLNTAPLSTGPSPPLYTAPLTTGPSPPLYTAPVSNGTSPPLSTAPFSMGTSPPLSTAPFSTGPSPPLSTGTPSTESSVPGFSGGNRSGTYSTTSGVLPTSPPSVITVYPSTCASMEIGSTTLMLTSTMYGCYSTCVPLNTGFPGGYGGPGAYGGPQSFGGYNGGFRQGWRQEQ